VERPNESDADRQLRCPECGVVGLLPIVYGYPTRQAVDAEERGEIVLGGCVISGVMPNWACPECENHYRIETQAVSSVNDRSPSRSDTEWPIGHRLTIPSEIRRKQ
jgi:rubredoxin